MSFIFGCGFWMIDWLMRQKEKHRQETNQGLIPPLCCGKDMAYVNKIACDILYLCTECGKEVVRKR
jgi:hypothetical protein